MLHSMLSTFNKVYWRPKIEKKITDAEAAAHSIEPHDNLIRVMIPPVPFSYKPNKHQELDFIKWRSPTYVNPMSDGVVDETENALLGLNGPEPFDELTLAKMALNCTAAYVIKKQGDLYVLDLAGISVFPYRTITISQFLFNLERNEFAIIEVSGRMHKPGDPLWETALLHTMAAATIACPAGAHNWVHFGFLDAVASVHDKMKLQNTNVWRLIAPHVRFTNRINYQGVWMQASTNNAPTLKNAFVPWLALPFYADQFRGGVIRNTARHYSAFAKHFDLPATLDLEIPYFKFLKEYYDVVEKFVTALDAELEDDAWNEFARALDAEMPGFIEIPRIKALAILIWQAGVVHLCDHLSYGDFGLRYGFMEVPRTLDIPFTLKDVGRWDRWKTRNFLKTFVMFNKNPNLDQSLLNVEAYGFSANSLSNSSAQQFKQDLLALDARLQSEGRAIVPVANMIQSVCF